MSEIHYDAVRDGRMHHHASGSMIETLGPGPRFKGEGVPPEGTPAFDWLPLAAGRYVDVPVTSSQGQTFLVLPFEFNADLLVKWVLSAKPRTGPFKVTKEECEKAIAKLQSFASELNG